MRIEPSNGARGFTLIETLVYLGLYALIITGSFMAAYGLFESSAHNATAAMLEEEGDYLVAKVRWALDHASQINLPVTTGGVLSISDASGSVTIASDGSDLSIQEGGAAPELLNDEHVRMAGLAFVRSREEDPDSSGESVSAAFTLYATTSDGHLLRRDFSVLEYVR